MKTSVFLNKLASILCIALIAASALCATGCDGSKPATDQGTNQPAASQTTTIPVADGAELGEGSTQFTFGIEGLAGDPVTVTVNTDAATVGAALVDLGLIAGDDSEYGLYVKTVNGETLDWDTDGKYWAFYVDGQYATSGVDATEVVAGATYSFKAE